MSATIIDGKAFAAGLRARIATGVTAFAAVAGRAPGLAVVLVGLGVNSLSMTPRSLPAVATVLSTVTLAQAKDLAAQAVAARTAGRESSSAVAIASVSRS